jgi:hypothetical protein
MRRLERVSNRDVRVYPILPIGKIGARGIIATTGWKPILLDECDTSRFALAYTEAIARKTQDQTCLRTLSDFARSQPRTEKMIHNRRSEVKKQWHAKQEADRHEPYRTHAPWRLLPA